MARINPTIMKRQRGKLGLSMEDLAARSGIDKGTIYRVESGRPKRNAQNTIEKLATALKISVADLVSARCDAADGSDAILFSRSQLNVRISHEARNALNLMSQRYGVRTTDIIEFAPLLFHIVAEESLRCRRESLEQLNSAREAVSLLDGKFPHISERLLHDWQAEEFEMAEERSIARSDIRGDLLDEADPSQDVRPLDYDRGEHNPFVAYLRGRLAVIGTGGEMDGWYDGWSPRYQIGREEALAYFAGDEEIADDVLHGTIGIHDIPRELRGSDAADARVAWMRDRIAELRSSQVELLDILDIKDLQS